MSREEKPWKNLVDVWNEIDNQGIRKRQVHAESSTQPKVYGSRRNSNSSYEDQIETGCKAIGSERPISKALRDDSGYSYESWADRSFPSTEDRTEESDDPSETYYDVVEHVESERESLNVCKAALSSVSNNCQLGNREWLQEGFTNKSENTKGNVTNEKNIPCSSGMFHCAENAASKSSDNRIRKSNGERVYHCPSNVPKGKPRSLNRPQNAAEHGKNYQTNRNFKDEEKMVRHKQDKDMLNNQLASQELNPNERHHQENFYDTNVHTTQQRRHFSGNKVYGYFRRNEEPEDRIHRMEPNSTTKTKRNEREHMKTGTQSKVYGYRRNITTSRKSSRDNRDCFRNNAVESEDDCAGNIQWKNIIVDEIENYGFGRGNEYVPSNRNYRNVNWQNNRPGMKSGYHSEGYVEDRHQNRSFSFPTELKKRFNEHDRNYDETMYSQRPHMVHHVVKHEVKVIHVNVRKGYRSKQRDDVPVRGYMRKPKHKQEERKAPQNGMDNFTWSIINPKKQLNRFEEEENNVANAKEKNFANAEKNIATSKEKKKVAEEGNNNTEKNDNIYQKEKVEFQQKSKIYSVWNTTSEYYEDCGEEKRQNKCDTRKNLEFKFFHNEKADEEYGNQVPTNKKNAFEKRQLLINYGKEISNLVSGCDKAMQLFLSLYQKEWIDARHQSIKLLDCLIKDVTENSGGGRMRDFFRYIGITAKVVTMAPMPEPYNRIVSMVATISDMLSKYFESSPMGLHQRRAEMLRSFQLDDDVSDELFGYELQCDFQMMDTRKLIEEFHHGVVERDYSDIELQQGLRKFLQEIAGFDPEHPSFPRQFYLALRRLKEQCPASDDDVYRAFCSGFDDGPEQMEALKFLNWRCSVDAAADGSLTKGWEEISLLLQSTTPSNKAELLKKLEDCTRILRKEERIYQNVIQSLDEYK